MVETFVNLKTDQIFILFSLLHSGSYTHLLRMLVAEFTLTENSANTTTSLLRAVCHADDSVILGTWLQETDHRTIEDQVCEYLFKLVRYIDFSITVLVHVDLFIDCSP